MYGLFLGRVKCSVLPSLLVSFKAGIRSCLENPSEGLLRKACMLLPTALGVKSGVEGGFWKEVIMREYAPSPIHGVVVAPAPFQPSPWKRLAGGGAGGSEGTFLSSQLRVRRILAPNGGKSFSLNIAGSS